MGEYAERAVLEEEAAELFEISTAPPSLWCWLLLPAAVAVFAAVELRNWIRQRSLGA